MDLGMMFSMGGLEGAGYADPGVTTADPGSFWGDGSAGGGGWSDGGGGMSLSGLSGLGQAFGSIAQGNAARSEAEAQARAREFEAQQAELLSRERRAEGERKRQETVRRGRIVASNALAIGAASGGGVSNAGFEDVLGDIFEEAEYQAGIERYAGEAAARSATDKAAASRYQASIDRLRGRNAQSGAMIGAIGPLFRSFDANYRYG